MTYRAGAAQQLQQAGQTGETEGGGEFCGDALAITQSAVGILPHCMYDFACSKESQSLYVSITVALHVDPALPGVL